jgi:hypothetical protein
MTFTCAEPTKPPLSHSSPTYCTAVDNGGQRVSRRQAVEVHFRQKLTGILSFSLQDDDIHDDDVHSSRRANQATAAEAKQQVLINKKNTSRPCPVTICSNGECIVVPSLMLQYQVVWNAVSLRNDVHYCLLHDD